MQVLSVAASSSGSVVIPFCPQYLGILPGAAGTVTTVTGKTLGIGTSCDLDTTGLNILGRANILGPFVGANRMWVIPMADGVLTNRTLQVDLVTGAGGTVTVMAFGDRKGMYPFINNRQTAIINTATKMENFFQIGGDFATTDNITIESNGAEDGDEITQQILFSELRAMANMYFCASTGTDWDVAVLSNWGQKFKSLSVIPVAQRTIYFTKLWTG